MKTTSPLFLPVFALMFSAVAIAQDTWSSFFEGAMEKVHQSTNWVLIVQKSVLDQPITNIDKEFTELLAARDISVLAVDKETTQDVWKYMYWDDNIHWVLCNLYNEKDYYSGKGVPGAKEIMGLMIKSGYTPLAERLRAFLQLYPDNGPANETNAFLATRLMMTRFADALQNGKAAPRPRTLSATRALTQIANRGGILSSREVADEVYSDLIVALKQLIAVPDWQLTSNWSLYGMFLHYYDPAKSSQMTNILLQMKDDILREWQKSPSNKSLATMWVQVSLALYGKNEVPWIEPCPGGFFPSRAFVTESAANFIFRGLSNEAIPFLDSVTDQLQLPDSVKARDDYIELMSICWSDKALHHAILGHKDKCLEAIGHAKMWSGKTWNTEDDINFALFISEQFPNLFTKEELEADIPNFGGKLEVILPPLPQQLRVIVIGNPDWPPELFPIAQFWAREELYIGSPTDNDKALLGSAIEAGAQWAFLKGSQVIDYGSGLEELKYGLITNLVNQASKYQRLSQYIAKYPNTIEGRAKRYEIAQSLYNKEALLEETINDALQANIPIDFDPNIEYPDKIKYNAVYHINRLKQAIYRWPYSSHLWPRALSVANSDGLWEAIISWNKIASIKNLIFGMISEIKFFDEPWVWHAQLPIAVHKEVIRELSAANREQELQDWLKTTVEGLERLKSRKLHYDSELLELMRVLHN
jgi:hypothetical protein